MKKILFLFANVTIFLLVTVLMGTPRTVKALSPAD